MDEGSFHKGKRMSAAAQAVPAVLEPPPEVLAQARSGEEQALRDLYETHAAAILRRLWRLTGDRARAEELCQDTFVIAFERLAGFRGEAKLSTWLHAIAFNLAREEVARRRRRRGLFSLFRRQTQTQPSQPALGPDAGLAHEELVGRLQRAIDTLAMDQREAYVLRVVEQLPLEECSELLGVPVSTISYRARRAEEQVRAAFEKEESR